MKNANTKVSSILWGLDKGLYSISIQLDFNPNLMLKILQTNKSTLSNYFLCHLSRILISTLIIYKGSIIYDWLSRLTQNLSFAFSLRSLNENRLALIIQSKNWNVYMCINDECSFQFCIILLIVKGSISLWYFKCNIRLFLHF